MNLINNEYFFINLIKKIIVLWYDFLQLLFFNFIQTALFSSKLANNISLNINQKIKKFSEIILVFFSKIWIEFLYSVFSKILEPVLENRNETEPLFEHEKPGTRTGTEINSGPRREMFFGSGLWYKYS